MPYMLSLLILHIDFQNVHVEFRNIKNLAYCDKFEIHTREKHDNWF